MNQQNSNFMKSIKQPKAVIFDTDNTLYPYDPAHKAATHEVEEKVLKVLGIKKQEFAQAFNEARKEIKERLGNTASSHSRLLYMQRAIEKLGLGTRILLTLDLEQTYWRTFLNNCRLFPGVLDFIHLLKSKGIVTANITDLTAQIQFRKLIYFGLDELFDYVVTSEEAGKDKPDRKPFELALTKLNINPEVVWMVGDNHLSDMYGAGSLGIVKIQKIHEGVVVGDNMSKPDFVINNYSEIMAFFELQ